MKQEMIFLFRHFRPLKSTLHSLAKFHTAKNICTAPYLIDLCAEMSWLGLNSWISGDVEVAEESLLRPVPVGLGSFHGSGHWSCLKLGCTALTHKHSLGAACISNTWNFFPYIVLLLSLCVSLQLVDVASTVGVCAQVWKKSTTTKERGGLKSLHTKTSKNYTLLHDSLHVSLHIIECIFWKQSCCLKYRPSFVIPGFTL